MKTSYLILILIGIASLGIVFALNYDDSTFSKQSLQTGETISPSGTFTSIIISSLGPILIVFFIVIYAIKKRKAKTASKRELSDN